MIERLNGRAAVGIAAVGLLLVVIVGWFGFVSPQRRRRRSWRSGSTTPKRSSQVTQALVEGPLLRLEHRRAGDAAHGNPRRGADVANPAPALEGFWQSPESESSGSPQPFVSVGGANVVGDQHRGRRSIFGIRDFLRRLRTRADLRCDDKVRASGRLFAVDSIQFWGGSDGAGAT